MLNITSTRSSRWIVITLTVLLGVAAAAVGARTAWTHYQIKSGYSLLEKGDVSAAKSTFEHVLRINPKSIDAVFGIAAVQEQSGDRLGALVQLREAAVQHPREPRVHLEVARALARDGARSQADAQRTLYQQAASAYDRAAALRPTDAEMLNDVGLGLRSIGRVDAAAAAFRKAAAAAPEWGGPDINLADTYREEERYDEALQVFAALERRRVKVPGYRIHNALAQVYMDASKPREAETAVRRAVNLNPRYSPARVTLALALLEQRRYSDASVELETAIQIDPQPDRIFFLCQLYALQKRATETVRCLRQSAVTGTPLQTIQNDGLFRFVRNTPEYQQLVGEPRSSR